MTDIILPGSLIGENKKSKVLPLIDGRNELIETKLTEFDFENDDPEKLEYDLLNSMRFYDGLGLAANQVGINARAFAMIHDNTPMVLFNPKVISVTEEKILVKEGCLTWYGLFPKILRPAGVTINWKDKTGQEFSGSFINISARIILHEYDHLNGYTFFDRVKPMHLKSAKNKAKIYIRQMKKRIRDERMAERI